MDDPNRENLLKTSLRAGLILLLWGAYSFYVFFFATAGMVAPPILGLSIAPLIPLTMWLAPAMPGLPRHITRQMIFIGVFLMPLWPVYLHLKLGPAPIITPTRMMFYMVTLIWLYEMSCVAWRRQQVKAALKRLAPLSIIVLLLFAQKFLSLPLAEGKSIAIKEFSRQTIIWLLPFLAVLTYIAKRRDLERIITLMLSASFIVAIIAIVEFATRHLLAETLSPLLTNADWLHNVLAEKSRSGLFRSQATHTHPLSLGEQMAMMIPFAMYKIYRPTSRRWWWAFGLLLLVTAALMTNSRGALIAGALSLGVTFFLMLFAWLKKPQAILWRPLAGMVLAGAIITTPIAIYGAWKLSAGSAGSIEAQSSQARLDQLEFALPKIMARPLNGYGTGRSTKVLGYYTKLLTIDNYYLNLALDLGLPGVLFFISQFIVIFWIGTHWGLRLYKDPYAGLYLAFAGMALSMMAMRSVLSITINIEVLMVLMAVMIGTAAKPKRLLKNILKSDQEETIPTLIDMESFTRHRQHILQP